jgi:hypothetical protein
VPINDIPGYEEVIEAYGPCTFLDFTDLHTIVIDTYYDELQRVSRKRLSIIFTGQKGAIKLTFQNVTNLRLSNIYEIIGFDVEDIHSNGWEEKNFAIYDYENSDINAYAESAQIVAIDIPQISWGGI